MGTFKMNIIFKIEKNNSLRHWRLGPNMPRIFFRDKGNNRTRKGTKCLHSGMEVPA